MIFLSAYGREETIARALESGAADYIVKPFSPTELTARVGAALRKRSRPDPRRPWGLCSIRHIRFCAQQVADALRTKP